MEALAISAKKKLQRYPLLLAHILRCHADDEGHHCETSFGVLDILQNLGSASRHGDGGSAVKLIHQCPELWEHLPAQFFEDEAPLVYRTVAMIDVPVDRLKDFAKAVAVFWEDSEYIYNESIERKDPLLEEKLARERLSRQWIPRPSRPST